jgi:hypothetical protein
MKKRNVNSFKLLTPEDKQYLRRVCRYLSSLGMRDGSIEMDIDSWSDFNFSDINWQQETHFSNNYSAEVPDGLTPIFEKIGNYIEDRGLFTEPEQSDINYERIEFDIDSRTQEVSVRHWWSFYGRGDSSNQYWVDEEGKEIFEEWEKDGVLDDIEVPNGGILTVKYNGSGDSGYIEGSFDENGDGVPTAMEDWCYRQLENNFGGWEINEGSDGEFIFNFNNMEIELVHTYNTEENDTDTIYEESFAE